MNCSQTCELLILSFDTEMTKITQFDWVRLNRTNTTELVLAKKLDIKGKDEKDLIGVKDKWLNIPSKMFVGDGIHWAAIVSLPIYR